MVKLALHDVVQMSVTYMYVTSDLSELVSRGQTPVESLATRDYVRVGVTRMSCGHSSSATFLPGRLVQHHKIMAVINTVSKLADAIAKAGGDGKRWWIKTKDETSCMIGLHDSEAREIVFTKELWGIKSPNMYLDKQGDWKSVNYDVETDVMIYCQETKISFGRV